VSESSSRPSGAASFLRTLFSPKKPHDIRVGIAGTFDVENYGDLLFPLIAEAAFARRGTPIQLLPFSPNSRSGPSWPFRVYSTEELPGLLPNVAALLIGGGQIIRFDKGYPVAAGPNVNLPSPTG
jgi:lipopolysaccharide transport system ATP-binding protein